MAKIIVRELLKAKGISIKELAGMMGISPSAVSQLLANPYPSLQVLERIATAIGVDVVDFFAQDYSYLNGYIETGGEIYPVRSREQFVHLIDKVDGIVFNPAAYTHTSVAILDALKAVSIPTVEVHISKVEERDSFRQIGYIRQVAVKTITGKGFDGYLEAIDALLELK